MIDIKADICIIGAGAGGLTVAAVASQLGLNVTLIERGKMGGDCLNYGCVPSKALLAAGHCAHNIQHADIFGIKNTRHDVDYKAVMQHVHDVIATIEPHDSQERFEKLGVKVIREEASFIDKKTIKAGDKMITAKKFIIATGSSPKIPTIPGLKKIDYATNETIFNLKQQPEHLLIIGGGPIGCEMAQAHTQLGCEVTILQSSSILPKDDDELVELARRELVSNGINIIEWCNINGVDNIDNTITINYTLDNKQHTATGSHLLIATGRQASIDSLQLENAGIDVNLNKDNQPIGIKTNKRLQTTNKKIFAIGDVTGPFQFTHMAGYQAGIVIRNVIFKLRAKVNYQAIPWVTYIDPELAHVGLTEQQAKHEDKNYRTLAVSFANNDRAQTEKSTTGKIKVWVSQKGKIYGVSIFGKNAGELIMPWSLAIENNLKIGVMANLIAPYPTRSEINKRVAGEFYKQALFSKKTKFIVKWLNRLI